MDNWFAARSADPTTPPLIRIDSSVARSAQPSPAVDVPVPEFPVIHATGTPRSTINAVIGDRALPTREPSPMS
jgi:hypothetical protein